MARDKSVTVALVWAQFAAYHVDRCEAVAQRLAGTAEVRSIEVASASHDYAWEPAGENAGISKVTLFPGHRYEDVSGPAKLWRAWKAMRNCDWLFIGLSYAEPWVILLSWLLSLGGVRVVLFSESKADDRPRNPLAESAKKAVLACYRGAIVGAGRHVAYFRSLGFGRRAVLPGYDTVSVERIRQAAGEPADIAFSERAFVFIGRFVEKKNLLALLEGFAAYSRRAGADARKLILAGSGELEPAIRQSIDELGLGALVDLPGFLTADEVPPLLARSLALVLVSREEQWGLVVNEALAVGLPVIVSPQVGSRDVLVGDGENGFVVDPASPEAIAEAMARIAADGTGWRQMCKASQAKAWMGDAPRLADAVEAMLGLSPSPTSRLAEFSAMVAAGGAGQ